MNDRPTDHLFDELESALEPAVQAVLAEPLPADAVKRVKSRAKTLRSPVASSRLPGGSGKRRWARYSSLAAALAIVVTATLWLLMTPSTGRAFAEVIKSVRQATSLEVTATMRWEKGRPGETYRMYLEENRLRMEHDVGVVVIVPDVNRRIALFLNVQRKLYQLSDLSNEMAVQITSPIDHFRRAKPDDAEHIGQEQLDGRLADLYRVRDPEFMGIHRRGEMLVWVDPTNRLPVKIVIRSGKSEQRFENFRWNQDLDDGLFSLEPPEDYVEGQVVGFPDPKAMNEPARPVSPSQLAKYRRFN